MGKIIHLINLDEIKALRVTCGDCGAYWSVSIEPKEELPPAECIYCKSAIPHKDIYQLSQKINHILNFFKDWKGSIELETEK